ncbi:hypothetical protein JCM10021v2_002190 [Rhodotorula toruloides]
MSPTGQFVPQPATQEEAKKARLPLGLLIPLNVCRHDNLYMTWKCDDERHAYEKCQYEDYISRMKLLSAKKAAEAEE